MKFRKKPIVIEAVQWTGDNVGEIAEFCPRADIGLGNNTVLYLIIPTLEGDHRANVGDWIIRGVKGEFYPCKPDIFEMTYETANGIRCECPMCEHHTTAREVVR